MEFSDKVVAITGAAGGIGQELCRYFGGAGRAIVALDSSDGGDGFRRRAPAATGIAIEIAVVDIGEPEAVASAFARFAEALGPIDILINNAGVSQQSELSERTTPEGWQR